MPSLVSTAVLSFSLLEFLALLLDQALVLKLALGGCVSKALSFRLSLLDLGFERLGFLPERGDLALSGHCHA